MIKKSSSIAIKINHGGKTYYGYSSCPKWLKDKYRKTVNYICQDCKKHEDEVGTLEPHRIKRGCEGGLYTVTPFSNRLHNVKMVCNDCHKKYNYSRRINY